MRRFESTEGGGRRALAAALTANLGIAATKSLAAALTGSVVMLAETAHSLADTSKQLLLFLGRRRSRRGADPEHPLGYGPERYFWAFVVAILLFPLGALWAGVESVEQLRDPQPITHAGWAAAVLFTALCLEAASLGVAVRETRRIEPSRSLWRFIRRSRDPDIPSVLLEDAGAVAGAAIGLLFLAAASVSGDPRWDAAGGLAVALLLLWIGAVLCVEFKSLLIGEAALSEHRAALEAALRARPGVREVVSLQTLHLAPDQLLVLARVALDRELQVGAMAELLDALRRDASAAVPHATRVHIEAVPERGSPGSRS